MDFREGPFDGSDQGSDSHARGGWSPASGDAAAKRSATTAWIPASAARETGIVAIQAALARLDLGADATATMEKQRLQSAASLEFGLGFQRYIPFIVVWRCLGLAQSLATRMSFREMNYTPLERWCVAPIAIVVSILQSNAVTIHKIIQANDLAALEEADADGSGFLARVERSAIGFSTQKRSGFPTTPCRVFVATSFAFP